MSAPVPAGPPTAQPSRSRPRRNSLITRKASHATAAMFAALASTRITIKCPFDTDMSALVARVERAVKEYSRTVLYRTVVVEPAHRFCINQRLMLLPGEALKRVYPRTWLLPPDRPKSPQRFAVAQNEGVEQGHLVATTLRLIWLWRRPWQSAVGSSGASWSSSSTTSSSASVAGASASASAGGASGRNRHGSMSSLSSMSF